VSSPLLHLNCMGSEITNKANSSGTLNAKHRELLELQAKAQARLAKSRARFADGVRDAQEVRTNLEWTSKKVS
jgi:biogenesis of lysosome-related organelles complex 1 subunit KXD1